MTSFCNQGNRAQKWLCKTNQMNRFDHCSPAHLGQTGDKKGERTEDNSRERGVESQLRAAAQRGYPEEATDQMVAPQDYDIRQSGRVFWLRPTDMSWHFPILMTIREEPFKNYRSSTSEKWKAKEDKMEEVKKQKITRNDDERSYADWKTSSWSWHQPMSWTSSLSSSCQQWSSDETRERSDWQPSADWSSWDQTRERSEWRSSGSWTSPFSWQYTMFLDVTGYHLFVICATCRVLSCFCCERRPVSSHLYSILW